MTEYERTTLGSLLEPGRALISGPFGSNISSRFFTDSGVPVIRGNNLTSGLKRFIDEGFVYVTEDKANELRADAIADDLIFTAAGTIGQVGLIPHDARYKRYVISNKQIRARLDRKRVDPLFAFYWFSAPESVANIKAHNTGSTIPLINLSVVRGLDIDLPSLQVQRRIVELLGSLDDKIELNRRMNETLEAMAQAIFRDWFLDFGPTRRKLEGATDPVTIMGGLVQDAERAQVLADSFPELFSDEGLPAGWKSTSFGSLLTDTIGGDWGKDAPEDQHTHPIAIIRGTDFPDVEAGGVGKAPLRYTTSKSAGRRQLRPYDILVEVSGGSPTQPTGRSIVVTQTILDRFPGDVVCASFCRRFRAADRATSIYAFQHLRNLYSEGGTWEYQNQSTGISNFQTTHFLDAEKVAWPGKLVVEQFGGLVGPMIEMRNRNETMTLAATRDLLLPKLMSGEIRLREAEEMLEAAQ